MTTGRDLPADQAAEESGGTAAWAGSTSSVVEGPFLDPASVRLPEGAKYVRAFVPTDGSTPFWRVYDADDQVIGTQPVDAPPPAVDPALSAAIDAWHAACHDAATIEDGMRRVVEAVRADLAPITLVPVEVFGGECSCHEDAEAHDRQGDCRGWGYGLMDAVQSWSDCNRAVGRIYRAEDLADPGEDPAKYRTPGEVMTVLVPRDQVSWFDRKWGDEASGRDSVAYIRGEVASAPAPLAELVTDEDVDAACIAATPKLAEGLPVAGMRAALEAYGARLAARLGRTP